ncbi:MAG: T9SS type A sorting domain-containing protein [Ignavibacteria bacterium]|nr:T9SS type A sorting domain-containing protein [Ignavibacteria bacterium]
MKKITIFLFSLSLCAFNYLQSQWIYQQAPLNTSYYVTIDFPGTQFGIAGGVFLDADFHGRGAYTSNGGTNWLASQVPDSCRVLVDIEFIDNSTGYCAGAYNIIAMNYLIDPSKYDKRTLRPIGKVNSFSADNYKGFFMRSTNSGQTWQPYGVLPPNVFYLVGLDFVNNTTAYAAASYNISGGVNDGVIKTTNAGLTWTALTMPENINSIHDVYFQDINTGFAVGYDDVNDTSRGVILKTTNAGTSWSRQVIMQTKEFSGISFSNAVTGFVVTISDPVIEESNGRVYKTTNSGVNWFLIINFPEVDLNDVNFIPGTGTALIYGLRYLPTFENTEFIAKTTNYGSNWLVSSINDTGLVIFRAKLLDQNNWYLSGADFGSPNKPAILHTTNGGAIGITPVSGEIPRFYNLSQNYPNPFNPVTNIKFSVPETGFVKLVIYNIIGREVKTLVSENMKPGVYLEDWDASLATSGVYFYKLITDNYTETKRMILVK